MYDRVKAVEYARRHAFNYNSAYYNFSAIGGDCTNFISQCLHAGGIPMNFSRYGWYYKTLNDRAPAWTGVNEFWAFALANDDVGVKITPCSLAQVRIGDVIQLFNGSRFYHTLLVTSVGDRVRVSAHDNNSFDVPLSVYGYTSLRCGWVSG